MTISLGTRIIMKADYDAAKRWMFGIIKAKSLYGEERYAIEFDEPFSGGHSCLHGHNKYTKQNHGQWVPRECFTIINKFRKDDALMLLINKEISLEAYESIK